MVNQASTNETNTPPIIDVIEDELITDPQAGRLEEPPIAGVLCVARLSTAVGKRKYARESPFGPNRISPSRWEAWPCMVCIFVVQLSLLGGLSPFPCGNPLGVRRGLSSPLFGSRPNLVSSD